MMKRGLTKAPSTVDELVAKQDAEYPDGPACNIGNGAQDPVTTRTYFGGGNFATLATSIIIPLKQHINKLNSLDHDKDGVEVEKYLNLDVGKEEER
jgi:hypothetical protein